MNENKNNFESLRRLLALKRHETPPPGYFEKFSREVAVRIRAGEVGGMADAFERLPWLFRLLSAFETKPAFAGGFACALCLLLLFGIVYAERPDAAPLTLPQTTGITSPLYAAPSIAWNSLPMGQPVAQPVSYSSTNPVFNANAQPSAMWFGSPPATVQQIPYRLQ
jgi:hypothetical protein